MDTNKVKKALLAAPSNPQAEWGGGGLSTGSTLLNLACSGRTSWGWALGYYYLLVGDSASGKTFLSLTCLAEAAKNPDFGKYRFIYDGAEQGALMDLKRFFGSGVANRMEPPSGTREDPSYSNTIEEFFFHVDDAFDAGKPFIYILDSMDVLSSEEETEKFTEGKKAARRGREVSGSYGTSKAKANSAGIRRIIPRLRDTGSILVVISQTRDNIGWGFEKKSRSGGHALRFYATCEMWLSVKGRITKVVRGEQRQLGVLCEIKVRKNRLTGKERSVEVPIFWSYGLDDIGSMVNYLVAEKHWPEKAGKVDAKEFKLNGSRDKITRHVEKNGLERKLQKVVAGVWDEIEEACHLKRKKRYE